LRVNNTVKVLTQDVLSKNVFTYQTNLLNLVVKDCNGNGIAGATARYETNYTYHWTGGASDSEGRTGMEFFPTTFGFIEVKVGASVNQLKNTAGQGIEEASSTYYTDSWRTIGTTDVEGLTPSTFLLLGSEYTFKVKKGSFEASKKVLLSGTADLFVDFVDPAEMVVSSARLASVSKPAEIRVYPNPSAQRIDVTAFSNNAVIEIYANNGRRVRQLVTKSGSGSIDISALPRDIYTVIVRDGNTVKTKRIIKD
jgi:hypothetical protein